MVSKGVVNNYGQRRRWVEMFCDGKTIPPPPDRVEKWPIFEGVEIVHGPPHQCGHIIVLTHIFEVE